MLMKHVVSFREFLCFLLLLLASHTCFAIYQKEMAVESVEQAKQSLKEYRGKPEDFHLLIPLDKLLTLHGKPVPLNVAMAIITDQILANGWMPNGFVDKGRVRYYQYSR